MNNYNIIVSFFMNTTQDIKSMSSKFLTRVEIGFWDFSKHSHIVNSLLSVSCVPSDDGATR